MADLDLESTIQQYAVALDHLSASPPPTDAQVLAVLLARDRVQTALNDALVKANLSAALEDRISRITTLDQTLKTQTALIAPHLQSTHWKPTVNPAPTAWWWFLEPPKSVWSDRLDWLWSAASIACLTVSLGLLGDIAPRFLTGTPDTLGAWTVTMQSLLTLVTAGGALTKTGQGALKRGLKQVHCPEKYWPALGLTGSVVLVSGFWTLRQSFPWIATQFYTQPGIQNYKNGHWSTAEEQFNRAIKLNAEDSQAHLQLGNLYTDLQLPDQARPQYQLAIQGGEPTAINNLARLNILKKDYPAAVSLLLKALEIDTKQSLDPTIKHAVLKNLAWARLKQSNYPDAEVNLEDAIALETQHTFDREAIADTHCLFAQVLDAQKDTKKALKYWKICNQNTNITIPEHDEWAAIAQKRLTPKIPTK